MNIKDHFVLQLYQAETMDDLSQSIFDLLAEHVPSQNIYVTYNPLHNQITTHANHVNAEQLALEYYKRGGHDIDIWLHRSPMNKFARHSDFTPKDMFLNSAYGELLKPKGLMYGGGAVGWDGDKCLCWVSCIRSEKEGDFTNDEMVIIEHIQPHIETAMKRLARSQEAILGKKALQLMIQSIPFAVLIMNWDLEIHLRNDLAEKICKEWKQKKKRCLQSAVKQEDKLSFDFSELPSDLKWALIVLKKDIEKQFMLKEFSPQESLKRRIGVVNSKENGVVANIDFLPSPTFSLSQGYFLVRLEKENLKQQTKSDPCEALSKLSKTERYMVELVAQGFTNQQIALDLGKSVSTIRNQLHSVFVKLGIKKRQEIVVLLR